jgi:DUF1680 family protein
MKVTIHDPFWTPRLETNARHAIFHQWEQLEASGCIDNFRIASGEKPDGLREGWFFADSDATKWLDAASRIYASYPDPKLAALMDGLIALLARAQAPDGYLFTYNQIHFPGVRWTNLQIEHELYCHGHMIEAGVSHHEATGKTAMLAIARRAADRVVADFKGRGPAHTPGHEEIEIALLRLYRATEHTPYLEIARQFLDQRGQLPRTSFALSLLKQNASHDARRKAIEKQRRAYLAAHPDYNPAKVPPGNAAKSPPNGKLRWTLSALSGEYFQQHAPIRKQVAPVGHSVRFGYLETAAAMLYRSTKDETLLLALKQAWEHMVERRMYITGGLGAAPSIEGFGDDYELDPEYAYAETCAALASLLWNHEMAQITHEAKYSELFEWQLYNAAAVGMGLDGTTYLYNNPLACRGGVTRKPWYAVPCCPSNLSRVWADLGRFVFEAQNDRVWIHQLIGSRLGGGKVPAEIEIRSGLPWDGKVRVTIASPVPSKFSLYLRLPAWRGFESRASLNGKLLGLPVVPAGEGGTFDPHLSRFLAIQRTWEPGDTLELDLDLPVYLRRAHPKVKGHAGKVALSRGPLVYCLESVDNPGVDLFDVRLDSSTLRSEHLPDLLGGVTVLRAVSRDGKALTFIPYQLWGNRGESQMNVWVNV